MYFRLKNCCEILLQNRHRFAKWIARSASCLYNSSSEINWVNLFNHSELFCFRAFSTFCFSERRLRKDPRGKGTDCSVTSRKRRTLLTRVGQKFEGPCQPRRTLPSHSQARVTRAW